MFNDITDFSKTALAATINEAWGLGVQPKDILPSSQQGTTSHVAFTHDMAVKFYKNVSGNPSFKAAIERETRILRSIEHEDLGVDTPHILREGRGGSMIGMSIAEGTPLTQFLGPPVMNERGVVNDDIIGKLAHFIVSFDAAMSKHDIIPRENRSLPAYAESLRDHMPPEARRLFSQPELPSRFMHNDMNPGNVFVRQASSLSVIDFQGAEYCDPHFQFVPMMSYHGFGPEGCAKLVEAVNRLSQSGKWLDMNRIVALEAVYKKHSHNELAVDDPPGRPNMKPPLQEATRLHKA